MCIFDLRMEKARFMSERNRIRQVIIVALLFMLIGTGLELYLLDHYEDTLQLIPLVLLGLALLQTMILFFQPTPILLRLFRVTLLLSALSGVYGAYLHLQANYEFEQEMRPSAENWDLLVESLSGALPALAPASMIVLALIGYSYSMLIKQRS